MALLKVTGLFHIIVSIYTVAAQVPGCPLDFIQHESSCYHIFGTPTLSWWDAMAFCGIYGDGEGTLAVVESESEQLFLEAQLKLKFPNSGKDFWLGGYDLVKDGTWVWVKKNEYIREYTHWGPGEPNGGVSENCLALFDGVQYKWNDAPCNLAEGFICEIAANDGGSFVG